MLSSTQSVAAQDFAADNVKEQSATKKTFDDIASRCEHIHHQLGVLETKLHAVLKPQPPKEDGQLVPNGLTLFHNGLLNIKGALDGFSDKLAALHERLEL